MGDVNEDGKLDIVSAGPEVFLGNGDGTFRPAVSFYPATTIIGVADFNLDGKPDILTLTNQTLAMLLGKGDDSFVSLPDYTRGFPSKILTGDFNGDGVTDLAFLEDGSGIATLLGQAGGKFKQGSSLQLNLRPGSLKFLVSGDFNHDGKVDIAFADSYSGVGAIYVAFGNGEGGFLTPVEYTVPDAVYSLVVADFNRDGNLDLAVSGAKGIYILFGTASGTFGSATLSASYLNEGSKVMASGDFNGDGLVDLFAAGSSGIQVYLGKGNGTFHTAATYAGSDANAVIVWDLNKDGKQDVVVSTTSGTEILLGNGTGTFSAGQTLQFTSGVIAVADFNKDGFPDLAIATSWDIAILLGNGDGTFQPAPVSGYGNGVLAAGIVAADFNGDGKPDIAFSSGDFEDDSGPVAVLLNTTP
jgi:WD40 repeat protein